MSEKSEKETRLQAAVKTEQSTESAELGKIFQDHAGLVLQSAYRITGSRSDAEDVLQTIFLRLMSRGYPRGFVDNLGSYLHRAAVNASIDLLRGRGSRRSVPMDQVGVLSAPEAKTSPEVRQREKELLARLRQAICQLSPQAAEMFTLRYLEGYRNLEIAELLGTSPGVVAVVLHRSRQHLREELRRLLGSSFLGENDE